MKFTVHHMLDGYRKYNRELFEAHRNELNDIVNMYPSFIKIGNELYVGCNEEKDIDSNCYYIANITVSSNGVTVWVDDTISNIDNYIRNNYSDY